MRHKLQRHFKSFFTVQRLIFKVLPGIALIAPPCLAGTNILVTAAEV